MPKKPRKLRSNSSKSVEHSNEQKDCCAFLDEEICIEAKVKVNPNVSIGDVRVECLESSITPNSKQKIASEECSLYVNQLIRIKIPVHFSAKVEAKEHGVICKDDCDESSSTSTSSTSSTSSLD